MGTIILKKSGPCYTNITMLKNVEEDPLSKVCVLGAGGGSEDVSMSEYNLRVQLKTLNNCFL